MKFDVKTINRRYQARKSREALKTIINREKRIAERLEVITIQKQR